MSFSACTISGSPGIVSVSLSGTKAIAGTQSNGIFWSTDSGQNWTQSSISGSRYIVSLQGSNGVAAYQGPPSSNAGVYYTTDGGQTWTISSDLTSGTYDSLVLLNSGLGLVSIGGPTGSLYYTLNYGVNWTQGLNIGLLTSPALSGTIGAVGTTNSAGIYYSTNVGSVAWSQTLNSTSFNSVALSGTAGIASCGGGANPALGIYYTPNVGSTNWTQSTDFNTTNFSPLALSGSNGVAVSQNSTGIYYTTNGGQNWAQSNINTGNFNSIVLSGSIGLAGSAGNGIYYTNDGGQNWTQSNINTGGSNALSVSGIQGIANGFNGPTQSFYYTSSPLCYEKNTLIKILENDEEIYKKICELKIGDMVKTYKNGYKKIKLISKFNYKCFDKTKPLNNIYKMKGHDIIITGGHSILVDELTEQEELNNRRYNYNYKIEDKKMLLACSSDKFDVLTHDVEYELYHLVLENDNIYGRYGIYINDDILSESCPENEFNKKI